MSSENRRKPEQVKLERLLRLIAALIEAPRYLSMPEVFKKVGVARTQDSAGYSENKVAAKRTFHRDMAILRELGIPVKTGSVPGQEHETWGCWIRKQDYGLPKMDLTSDELAALHLASAAVRFDQVAGAEALWKLGGRVGERSAELAEVPMLPGVPELFQAVTERRVVKFHYRDESRSVEPWTLAFESGYWYLVGYDHLRSDRRVFRADRIQGSVTLGPPGHFQHPVTEEGWVPLRPWEFVGEEAVTARLLVEGVQAARAARRLGLSPVEETPDGAAIFEVRVQNAAAFRSFVLEFLEHAEILDPPELRADMIAWLEGVGA